MCPARGKPLYTVENYASIDSVLYQMGVVRNRFIARLDAAFAGRGITTAQWGILRTVAQHRGNTAAELARKFRYDAGALTRMLDRLEQKGWITRSRDSADRRCVVIAVTPAGMRVMKAGIPIVVQAHNESLAGFTAAELAQLKTYLARMQDNLAPAGADAAEPS